VKDQKSLSRGDAQQFVFGRSPKHSFSTCL
jgi:hypothetical protein